MVLSGRNDLGSCTSLGWRMAARQNPRPRLRGMEQTQDFGWRRSICASRGLLTRSRPRCREDSRLLRPTAVGPPPSFSARATQPAHRLADRAVDGHIVQTLQKAIQRREVRHAPQPQRLAQLAMFAQPHFGFAKGPVFVAHQEKSGQQLRLIELVLAESAAVTRQHRVGDPQVKWSGRKDLNLRPPGPEPRNRKS